MFRFDTVKWLLTCILLASSSLTERISAESVLHGHVNRNITLNFDDLPTENGYGNISQYHHLDFSSFRVVNISFAAAAGSISSNDTGCATSSDNALIAQRSKTPTLWPLIVLNPLAHDLPGEIPYFSFNGLSTKPMNQSNFFACHFITASGLDNRDPRAKTIREYHEAFICYPPYFQGGFLDISNIFPGWGKGVNTIQIYAEAEMRKGDYYEWLDWPFCVDDISIERLDTGDDWQDPQPWWMHTVPLLPPLAPFEFEDEGGEVVRQAGTHSPFSTYGKKMFDDWRRKDIGGVLLSTNRPYRTSRGMY